MLNQKGGSRTDTLIKLVLIFFISLLSFSVGTFVGKQFSDSQHKLAQLESEFDAGGSRETASIPTDGIEVKPEAGPSEKDIEQIAEEFTKPESVVDMAPGSAPAGSESAAHHGDTQATDHTQAEPIGQTSHDTREVASEKTTKIDTHGVAPSKSLDKIAERVAEGKTPAEVKPEVKSPLAKELPSTVAASSVGKFTVQISSHQAEDEATDQAAKLKAKGFSAFVVPAVVNGKSWYRVSVGLFDKRDDAKDYREKLLREAGVASAFVQPIVQ